MTKIELKWLVLSGLAALLVNIAIFCRNGMKPAEIKSAGALPPITVDYGPKGDVESLRINAARVVDLTIVEWKGHRFAIVTSGYGAVSLCEVTDKSLIPAEAK